MKHMHYTRDNMADLLRGHDINPTHQRIEIAHALFSRQEHLSADQVMAIVNTRHSETSKATVYNTLKLFLEKRLIRELIVDPSKVFFDPNTIPHHHFYEVDSGKLSDIDAESGADHRSAAVARQHGDRRHRSHRTRPPQKLISPTRP